MKLNAKIIYGVLATAVIGVSYYLIKQSKLLKSICYSLNSVDYIGAKDGKIQNNVNLKFYNYADVPVKIKGYNLSAFIDGTEVSKIISDNSSVLNPRTTTNVVIPTYTDTAVAVGQVFSAAIEQFIDEQSSSFTLKGTMTISMGLVSINNYPFETTYNTQQLIEEIKSEEECPPIS